ncbi:hypothetical protein EGX91_13755 [Chryseobacterium indologenes]|nr:hypothetical protein EGX91_13755 [Chryseobacterium indologenes]
MLNSFPEIFLIVKFIQSIINYQLSIINYQLSIINYQLSIINYQLSIINYQLSIINYFTYRASSHVKKLCVFSLLINSFSGVSITSFTRILRWK